LTPILGRDREIGEVGALLRRPAVRLLTLVGPGGVGKTRLALAVGEEVLAAFPDGVHFVDLSPLDDSALVLPTIAHQLELHEIEDRSPLDRLVRALAHDRRLLVLDNVERLVAVGPQLQALLAGCRDLTLLATSRIPLGVRGERQYPLAPLPAPERRPDGSLDLPPVPDLEAIPSVGLFVARAAAADPAFGLTAENAAPVAEICARLDGLPLAIELAAAWSKLLPPAAILDRLAEPLALLTTGPRDLPARQQTLRATLAWSHDLLTPAAQTLFRRLAAFVGGFTLEAAEAVGQGLGAGAWGSVGPCSASPQPPAPGPSSVLDQLAGLVDQSLVRPLDGSTAMGSPEPRFGMLETVREYGLELLAGGEDEEVRRAHAAWCLTLVERAGPELSGPEPGPWLDRLEAEHDNLRAALGWAVARGETELGLRLAGGLWRFWRHRGYWTEGRGWLERTLALGEGSAAARATALNGAGVFADDQGDYERAVPRYEAALALFRSLGDRRGAAGALSNLGDVARTRGDYDRALALYEEALALYREIGATRWVGFVLNALGVLAIDQGDVDRAALRYDEALAVFRALGHRPQTADVLTNLGTVAQARQERRLAGELTAAALAVYRDLGDRRGMALTLYNLGGIAFGDGDWERAASGFRESLVLNRELGDRFRLAQGLDALAATAAEMAQPERAALLHGAATALREASGMVLGAFDQHELDQWLHALRATLGEHAFAAAWSAGRTLPLEEAIAEALAVTENLDLTTTTHSAPAALPTSLDATPASEAGARAGLTRRELEVLRLLIEGRSDPEIAAALSIARRTASKYVATILEKLGAASRTAAAMRALREGLV
jgi:predicted ATPase/DNA-binding NarL/FixJ family response regulator